MLCKLSSYQFLNQQLLHVWQMLCQDYRSQIDFWESTLLSFLWFCAVSLFSGIMLLFSSSTYVCLTVTVSLYSSLPPFFRPTGPSVPVLLSVLLFPHIKLVHSAFIFATTQLIIDPAELLWCYDDWNWYSGYKTKSHNGFSINYKWLLWYLTWRNRLDFHRA